MGISMIGLKCTYPKWDTKEKEHEPPPPLSPISKEGFANFREKYKNELYSKYHNVESAKHIEE